MAVPICLLMFVALAFILLRLNKPEIKRIDGVAEYVAEQRAEMGPLSRAEKNTLIAFGITVLLWIFPGIVALFAGNDSDFYTAVSDRLDEGMVAVFGASLLYLLPIDWEKREFTLRWRDAAEIDWGTIVLFGTGIIFGSLLADTGLAETIGTSVADALGLTSIVAITIFAVLLAIIVSETTSNTASAAVVVPIVIPIAVAAGVNPFVPALAATFAASFGFMLPVSTPQNAVVYGSGAVPITTMIRSGVTFDIVGAILIIVILPLMVAVLGLGGDDRTQHRRDPGRRDRRRGHRIRPRRAGRGRRPPRDRLGLHRVRLVLPALRTRGRDDARRRHRHAARVRRDPARCGRLARACPTTCRCGAC